MDSKKQNPPIENTKPTISMSNNPPKGRFTVNNLSEGEKIEIVVDIIKSRQLEDPEPDLKKSIENPKGNFIRTHYKCSSKVNLQSSPDFPEPATKPPQPEKLNYDESFINTSCLTVFHNLMKTKYIEMINFHREEMLDYIKKDIERQAKIMKLLDDIATCTKEKYRLEQENSKLKKIILDKGSSN